MTTAQMTWVRSKQCFWTAHRELRETYDLTIEDAGMHQANTVRNVIVRLQEVLYQEQSPTENATTVLEPVDNMANAVKMTHKQLVMQLHHMQAMMQEMKIQYSAAPHHSHQDYVSHGYHRGYTNYCGQGGRGA